MAGAGIGFAFSASLFTLSINTGVRKTGLGCPDVEEVLKQLEGEESNGGEYDSNTLYVGVGTFRECILKHLTHKLEKKIVLGNK